MRFPAAALFSEIARKRAESQAVLATIVAGEYAGEKLYIEDGRILFESNPEADMRNFQELLSGIEKSTLLELDGERVFAAKLGTCPRLILCGAGHVSAALVKMAKLLDFETWVLDDRAQFTNAARIAGADRVICQNFETALCEVPDSSDNYYVCVTRGHRFDLECLCRIFRKKYAYVGMMGSKKRSILVREALVQDGISDEKAAELHAPVGLDIGAQTPEEIAVSILAELIEVRNRHRKKLVMDRNILRKLSDPGETGVLCTIISKRGSAPRDIGTQMYVSLDTTVSGTIGGGCAEAEIISVCRRMLQLRDEHPMTCRTMTLNMTADEAENAGMVCGGTLDVFLEPIWN